MSDPSGLSEYLHVVRRRYVWIVATALLVGLLSFLLSMRQAAVYTSTAEVLVLPLRDATLQPVGPVEMETEARIAASSAVAAIATPTLQDSMGDAELEVAVDNPVDTETLVIAATSDDPAVAKAAARAYADAYLAFRSESLLSSVASATEALREVIKGLDDRIAAATAELRSSEGVAAEAARFEISTLVTERTALESELNGLSVAGNVRVGEILEPATEPETLQSAPQSILLGVAVGALFGLGLAFLRDRLDPRFTARADVEAATATSVLAMIPFSRAIRRRATFPRIDPYANEAFRGLRARILHLHSEQPFRTIAITSATHGEGKGTVARNLALALAEGDKRIVVVFADLRGPMFPGRLRRRRRQPANETGLLDVLAGTVTLSDAIRATAVTNLHVLPPGRDSSTGDVTLLANTGRMREVLDDIAASADFVIIDTTPILGVSDALELAPVVDAVVLTVDADAAKRVEVEDAALQLRSVGARLLGVVVTKVTEQRFRGYHHRTYGKPLQPQPASGSTARGADGRREPVKGRSR